MTYTKDKQWLMDELALLTSVMSTPALGANTAEERVGAYMGTHRAAVIILEGIMDGLDEMEDNNDNDTL